MFKCFNPDNNYDILKLHDTWWFKTYEALFKGVPRFLKNVWRFRKPLYHHSWWRQDGMLMFMEICLDDTANNFDVHAYPSNRTKTLLTAKMRRVVELIRNHQEDNYLEAAEKELGSVFYRELEFIPSDTEGYYELADNLPPEQSEHNSKVYERSWEIEEEEWNELWDTLRGKNLKDVRTEQEYDEQFDGSGLKNWWF